MLQSVWEKVLSCICMQGTVARLRCSGRCVSMCCGRGRERLLEQAGISLCPADEPLRHVSLCNTKGKGEKESGGAAASYSHGKNQGLEKLGQGMM